MKRNTVLVILVALVALLFLVNPFKFFQNRAASGRPPAVEAKTLDPILQFASSSRVSPADYILASFARHDIVFLGEFYKIRQNVALVAALVPRLAAAGIRSLGIEHALSDSQPDIDALLSAPAWNEGRARAIVIDWIPTWGYQEYIDIFHAAWEVNRRLSPGEQPFRLVGLNVRQNWELLKTDRDARDPATVQRILAYGIPDAHMAEVILRELAVDGGKALVFCGTQHAFTRFRSREYEKNAADMKLTESRRAGNIVYDRIGGRAATILLHAPWPDRSSRTGLAWAAGGVIDTLIAKLPPDGREAGWDTAGTPIGSIPVTSASYLAGYRSLTLSDLCDGYVVQGAIADYRAVTPIADFVPAEKAEQAVRNFPGPKPRGLTVADVNRSVLDDAKAVDDILAGFGREPAR